MFKGMTIIPAIVSALSTYAVDQMLPLTFYLRDGYPGTIMWAESRIDRYRPASIGAILGTSIKTGEIVLAVYEIRLVRLAAFGALNRSDFLCQSFEEIIEFNPHPFGRSVLLPTARSLA